MLGIEPMSASKCPDSKSEIEASENNDACHRAPPSSASPRTTAVISRSIATATQLHLDQPNSPKTLVNIFRTIKSPKAVELLPKCSPLCAGFVERCLSESPYMMRTSLYTYQRNSVAKMIINELEPCLMLNPTLESRDNGSGRASDARPFFVHPIEIANTRESHELHGIYCNFVRGGIIAEDMGTGKTCECLALIAWTRTQVAHPRNLLYCGPYRGEIFTEDVHDHCMIPTPLGVLSTALHCNFAAAGLGPFGGDPPRGLEAPGSHLSQPPTLDLDSLATTRAATSFPKLAELATRKALLSGINLRVLERTGAVPKRVWQQAKDYPVYCKVYPDYKARASRKGAPEHNQGDENGGMRSINVLLSSSTLVIVPDNLIDQWQYEIYKHFESAEALDVLVLGKSTDTIPSPAQLIRYDVVLITDYRFAHEESKSTTEFRGVSRKCVCSYVGNTRTIVCRCPAGNLAPMYLSPLLQVFWKRVIVDEGHSMSNRKANRALMAEKLLVERRWICTGTPTRNLAHAADEPVTVSKAKKGELQTSPSARHYQEPGPSSPCNPGKSGNAQFEADDFVRLGRLVSVFLKLPPFSQQKGLWSRRVAAPFMSGSAEARRFLVELLDKLMIRNQPADIERSVQLPPLHEKTVVLEPTYLQAITYNIYIAFFHINAVMTEREHQDYFFHERNRVHLALLLNNLYMSCSWLPNRSEELEPSIMRVRKALEDYQRGDRNFPLSDVKLLGRCIEAMESAVNDPLWNYLMTSQDLGYWVDNFPPEELEGVPKGLVSPNHAEDRTAVVPDLIYRLQGRVKAHLAATASDAKSGAGANGPGAPLPPSPSTSGGIDKAANTQPVLDWYKRARVMGSTSTKFGYLLSQILRHHKTEKCVVFTQNQNDMYFIYHALKILRVPALYYYKGKDTNDAKRSQIITTFNTSQIYSVILMDTRLAAFGINLTAASRIWFFSPVWQTSTERQAIKRAHRIGQARTVFVETLVTKGSIEEAMVARRREISRNHEHTITKSMEDDSKMRQMIHQADFISLSSCCYSTDGLSAPQDPCSECARTGPWTTGHVKWGEPIDPSIPVVDPRLHTAALAAGRCGAYGDLQRGHTTHKCVDHNRGPLVDISAARPPAPVMRSPLASPNGPEASIRHHTITKEEASNRATSSPKRKVTFAATSPTPTKRSPLRRIRLKVPDEGKSDSKKALNTRSHSTRIGITAHEQRQYGGAAPTSHQRYCNVECTAPYGTLAVNIKSGDSEPSAPYPADYLTDSSRETTAAKPVGGCVSEPRSLDSFPIKRQLLTSYTGPSSLSTFSTNPDSTMPPKKRVKKAVTFNI